MIKPGDAVQIREGVYGGRFGRVDRVFDGESIVVRLGVETIGRTFHVGYAPSEVRVLTPYEVKAQLGPRF
jgi:transcription antitermination factor NusG